MMKRILTLCIVHQHPRILLGMKKKGFGKGWWNGFGGKVEEGESIKEAARRETKEETGIDVKDLNKIGIIEFRFKNYQEILEVHLFKSEKFSGEPTESEEMSPKWFHVDKIPFDKMWPDDIFWMPLFLSGKKFSAKFIFSGSPDQDYGSEILEKELIEVDII